MSLRDDSTLCDRCGQIMSDVIDGNCDSVFHQQIKARLESDPTCVACFESYKKAAELCKQALLAPVPVAVGDRLSTFLRKECCNKD